MEKKNSTSFKISYAMEDMPMVKFHSYSFKEKSALEFGGVTTPIIMPQDAANDHINNHKGKPELWGRRCHDTYMIMTFILSSALFFCVTCAYIMTAGVFLNDTSVSFNTVVAEGNVVSLMSVNKGIITSISINEVAGLNHGGPHEIIFMFIPTQDITYTTSTQSQLRNGIAALNTPIINEMYVYLRSGSTIDYTICMGNGNTITNTNLYVFDQEVNYIYWVEYGQLRSPLQVISLAIGIDSDTICNRVNIPTIKDGYYFIIMSSPEDNIAFQYNMTANLQVITLANGYADNYQSCQVEGYNDNCNISTSSTLLIDNQNMSLLAYTIPKYAGSTSKISHLNITVYYCLSVLIIPGVMVVFGIIVWFTLLCMLVDIIKKKVVY
jgi:hypothetical protein